MIAALIILGDTRMVGINEWKRQLGEVRPVGEQTLPRPPGKVLSTQVTAASMSKGQAEFKTQVGCCLKAAPEMLRLAQRSVAIKVAYTVATQVNKLENGQRLEWPEKIAILIDI
jgi:hypothetical protein